MAHLLRYIETFFREGQRVTLEAKIKQNGPSHSIRHVPISRKAHNKHQNRPDVGGNMPCETGHTQRCSTFCLQGARARVERYEGVGDFMVLLWLGLKWYS